MTALEITLAIVALALAAGAGWLLHSRARLSRRLLSEQELLRESRAACELAQARLADIERNQQHLRDMFGSLAGEALKHNSTEFLKLAKSQLAAEQEKHKSELEQRKLAVEGLVKPLHEKLEKTGETLRRLEEDRIRAQSALREQAENVARASSELRVETSRLVQALRKPQVRGRYGEIQLERVVELAGMRDYCDFNMQTSMRTADGQALRPDMVVRLPNDRLVVIDAKTNIEAYLDAIEADSPELAEEHLDRFARHVFDQAAALSKKNYAQLLDRSPEFVVMFIPGDQFIDAALQRRPKLLDFAAECGVIIASPSTLIGLLRAVHVGWREKKLSDSANELFLLGRELHERAVSALEHAAKVGKAIDVAKERYNTFVGSVDRRLMPTLRKFEEQGACSSRALADLTPLDGDVRALEAARAETPSARSLPNGEAGRSDAGASADSH